MRLRVGSKFGPRERRREGVPTAKKEATKTDTLKVSESELWSLGLQGQDRKGTAPEGGSWAERAARNVALHCHKNLSSAWNYSYLEKIRRNLWHLVAWVRACWTLVFQRALLQPSKLWQKRQIPVSRYFLLPSESNEHDHANSGVWKIGSTPYHINKWAVWTPISSFPTC